MRYLLILLTIGLVVPLSAQEITLSGPETPIPLGCWIKVPFTGLTNEEIDRMSLTVNPGTGYELDVTESKLTRETYLTVRFSSEATYTITIGFNAEHVAWRKSLALALREATAARPDPTLVSTLRKINDEAALKYPSRVGSCVIVALKTPTTTPEEPEPEEPTTTAFEDALKALTVETIENGATPATALEISNLFSVVAASVENGETPPSSALAAISAGMKRIFSTNSDEKKWTGFRKELNEALDILRQEGSLSEKEQYAKAFNEISNGVRRGAQSR